MTIEEMKERKRELGYSYEKIAELSGLPVGTVQKVLGGITKSPRYETLKALESILSPKYSEDIYNASYARDAVLPYNVEKCQGQYTIDDYFAIPDEKRVELIDGVIYDMASPTNIHQLLVVEICTRFRDFIFNNKGKCIPLVSPIDVQLDCDDKTIVQPDIMIVCDRTKLKFGRVFGAPDLIVEILSPSTRKRDASLKMGKYMNAGVREYWIVDPLKKRVYVYEFEKDVFPVVYTFEHKVPVGIFDGECEVDFAEIYDYISFLYEGESE